MCSSSLCCTPASSSRCTIPCPQSNSMGKPSNCISTLDARRSGSTWHVPVPRRIILLICEIFPCLARLIVGDDSSYCFVNYAVENLVTARVLAHIGGRGE